MESFIAMALLLPAACLVYAAVVTIYRLYLHPLADFPGPRLAAATKYYEFYYDIVKRPGGCFMFEINRMHEVYGPIVRINPDELHVQDPAWFDTLYAGASAGVRDKYAPAAMMTGSPLGIFGTIKHNVHRQRRQVISPMFSKRSVFQNEPMIYRKATELCDFVSEQITVNGYADARTSFLAFTTDVLCAHTFDLSLDLLHNFRDAVEWKGNIKAVAILTPIAKQFVWLIPTALKLPMWLFQTMIPPLARIVALHKNMHLEAAEMVQNHSHGLLKQPRNGSDAPNFDVFRTILFSNLPESEKSRNRIAQEAFTILVAGGETTGRVMTNAAYFLLANKETMLKRLVAELTTVMPDATSMPDSRTLEALPFFNACLKEALRITALVTSRLPLVSPNDALSYGDWTIPPGTPISMTPRDVLLDENIFENPLEYQPQRWLGSENPALSKILPHFIPFGKGTRMCIGMNLAMAELYIGLAVLFRRMDLELFDTIQARDVDIVRDCFIGEVSPRSTGIKLQASCKS